MLRLFRGKRKPPLNKACSVCQAPAQYGYSDHAEENLESIRPRCLDCLTRQVRADYANFEGRAVVVQPVPGPPVYVFQPAAAWSEHFTESRIADDVLSLLEHMSDVCYGCAKPARFLWVESGGLTEDNFPEVLDRGISETLLKENPEVISLCASCCVFHISRALESGSISYLEVCSPKGSTTGFVLPMGY